tara:strand:+ start:455 stop:1120 length:666 start_codon:yes stop_codon:yes gene_type:complete
MKKLLLSVVFSVLYVTSASADLGVNVGVSGNAGIFAASASEVTTTAGGNNQNGSEHGSAGWASVYVEKSIGDRLMIGIDYVPMALETDTTETAKSDKRTASSEAVTASTNKVQIDFEDLTTVYIGAMLTENFYVKAGLMHVEVITNESLGTGGAYGNVELDGSMFGMGYHASNDNGTFFRFEGNYLSFDGNSVTSSTNSVMSIKLKNLDGVTGKVSVGKTF